MIEQGFHYADSTVKEMTDLFETKVENLEPKKDLQQLPRNPRKKFTKKEQTLRTSFVDSNEVISVEYKAAKK